MNRGLTRNLGAKTHVASLVAIWVACGLLVCLGLSWQNAATQEATSSPQPETVVVGKRSQSFTQSAQATFAVMAGAPLVSPTAGTVTAIFARSGSRIENGARLLSIDGRTVAAFGGKNPPYRELRTGDTGDDVAGLARFLRATGRDPGPPGLDATFGHAMQQALIGYQRDRGLDVTGIFSPKSVIYVPDATVIDGLEIRVGDTVESGQRVASGRAVPASVRFSSDDSASLANLGSTPVTVFLGSTTVDLPSLHPDERAVVDLFNAMSEQAATGTLERDELGEQEGATAQTFSGLRLARKKPITRGTLPGSAIFASPSGHLCVFLRHRTDPRDTAVVIPADSSPAELGSASVPADLSGKRAVRDPTRLPAEVRSQCA